MFEPVTQVAALSRRVFDYRGYLFGCIQCSVDGFGDCRQTLLFRNPVQMAAWMEVEQFQTQLLAALYFIEEGAAAAAEPAKATSAPAADAVVTPAARRLVKEMDLDPAAIAGSGKADPGSLVAAVEMAARLTADR